MFCFVPILDLPEISSFLKNFYYLFLYDIKFHKLVICYHGKEESKLWIQWNDITIGEHKLLLSFFLRHQHNVDLLGGYWQHWQFNAVELVETPPTSWLRQSWWTSEGDRKKKEDIINPYIMKNQKFSFHFTVTSRTDKFARKKLQYEWFFESEKGCATILFLWKTVTVTVYKWWGVSNGIFSYVLKTPPLEIAPSIENCKIFLKK